MPILVSVNAGETVMAAEMDSLSCATNIICCILIFMENKSGENRRALWPRTITHRNRPTRIILKILRRTRARTAPRKALLTARTKTISKTGL